MHQPVLKRQGLAFGHGHDFGGAALHGRFKLCQGTLGQRVGVVVHRDDLLGWNPVFHRKSRVFRVHGEIATDRNQHQVGLVAIKDELHVAKQACIAHMPDLEAVFQLDDVAHGLTRWM